MAVFTQLLLGTVVCGLLVVACTGPSAPRSSSRPAPSAGPSAPTAPTGPTQARLERAEPGVPRWLVFDRPDRDGRRPAVWTDATGNVYSVVVKGDERPQPPESAKFGEFHRDASLWRSPKEPNVFIEESKGEIVLAGCDSGTSFCKLQCWLVPPCSLRCDSELKPRPFSAQIEHDGRVLIRQGPPKPREFTASMHFEPAPSGERECRQALVLVGSSLIDDENQRKEPQ